MIILIRNMLEQALKTNDNLYMAVLTGCLRIARESIFTGLNNFNIFSITDQYFDEYFGFTDKEVKEMLKYYGAPEAFDETKKWLDIYFNGTPPDFTPPLSMNTTPFRKAVWNILLGIPFGKTMTYGEISKIIAKQFGIDKMSAQAVGGAVGHNSISLIIPCHRVVGTNGSLTGYAGGLEKKVWLLTMEKVNLSKLFVPKTGTAL